MPKETELLEERDFFINGIPTTKMYINPYQCVVIHQKETSDEGKDQFIYFPYQNANQIIKEIKRLKKLAEEEYCYDE